MFIFKNAVTSILRNKSRNFLIGIIIVVISCASAVTLAINSSSNSLIESYKEKYQVEATIGFNRQNMMQEFNPNDSETSKEEMNEVFSNANDISIEDIEKYKESEYVKDYYYTMETNVNSESMEKAEITLPDNPGRGSGEKEKFNNMSSGDFTLRGYSSIESMNEFIEGSYTIVDGEVSDDFEAYYCLINEELATLNGISVGDTITVIDSVDDSKTYDLVVTGIYAEKENEDNQMNMFANSVNTIITNTKVLNDIKNNNEDIRVVTSPTFILTSSDVVEKFEQEVQDKGLSEYLSVQTNLDQVENATSTISNVKNFALSFLIITFIIGTIVLLVINMINIRERKYEIGVLRTIGMKKSKVCLQFLSELFIVSFVGLIIGAMIGAAISVPVSNRLLENEINSSQNQTNNIRENFGKDNMPTTEDNKVKNFGNRNFNGIVQVEAFDSIDAVVDFKVLLQLLGLGLLITMISGTSAMISIQKFSPLEILKERS